MRLLYAMMRLKIILHILIKKFLDEHIDPSISAVLLTNEFNLGYAKNFLKASTYCTGDVVFFSDQDDLWLPKKIEDMLNVFEKNAQVGGLVCNYELIDEKSNLVKHNFNQNTGIVKKVSFKEMVRDFYCGGLNFALKADYINKYLDFIIQNNLSHDVPLGIIIASRKQLFYINEVYVQHRVHAHNATQPEYRLVNRIGNLDRQLRSAKNKLNWLEKCREVVFDWLSDEDKYYYDNAIEYYKKTVNGIKKRDKKLMLKLCFCMNKMISKKFSIFNFISVVLPKNRGSFK